VVNQKKAHKRGRGRPKRPGGRDPVLAVRVPKPIITALDKLAEKKKMSRADVLKEIIEAALPSE
jgi:hypothetical protein